jgi:hypothetical protein
MAGRREDLAVRRLDELVDQPVLVRDAAGPVAVDAVLERLRFSNAFVAVAGNVLDERVDPLEDPAVLGWPASWRCACWSPG